MWFETSVLPHFEACFVFAMYKLITLDHLLTPLAFDWSLNSGGLSLQLPPCENSVLSGQVCTFLLSPPLWVEEREEGIFDNS